MHSPEPPAKRGNDALYPHRARFAKLLDWHLDFGTRSKASPDNPGARWSNKEFAEKVGVSERAVRYWRRGKRPDEIGSIEQVLFGSNALFKDWRLDLRAAYDGRPPGAEVERPCAEFLGRDGDIGAVLDVLLASGPARAILVQGPPGIGKTELTKAVAHHPAVVERFGEDHRWFVTLETATTASLLQDAVTRAVGADPQSGWKATLAHLRQRAGLLVLDNLETPWDPPAERQATEATLADLAAVTTVALLASFRGRERVGGARWALVHPVERLRSPFDAELFGRIAQYDFAGDPHLAPFLAALDGLPLAIDLVARQAFGHTALAALWAQWQAVGAGLAAHPDYAAGRLTSLPHSIELSLASSRMTPAADRLFRLLGQLPAGIVAEDRDHLLGARDGFAAEEVLRRLGLVIERGPRLDMLSPIREYARATRPPQPPDDAAWPARYLDLTERLGEAIGTNVGEGNVQRLEPEFSNISAAIQMSLPDRLADAMAVLDGLYRLTVIAAIPAPVLDAMAGACRQVGDVWGDARCIEHLGDIALARSDHEAARQAYEKALPFYRKIGAVLGEANCIRSLGEIARQRSDHDAARKAYEEVLPLYRKVGSVLGEANCIFFLGEIALARGDHETARDAYEQALPLYSKIGKVRGEANCILSLGEFAMARSDHDAAGHAYEQALPLYRKIGDMLGEANCIKSLGDIALARSDHDAARQAFEEALPLYRKVGSVLGEAYCIAGFGAIALARGDHDAARQAYEQAMTLYRKVGDVLGEANCIAEFGDIALARSDRNAARQAYEQALPLYRKIGNGQGEAYCLAKLKGLP